MKLWLRIAALSAFLILPLAKPGSAQYMFLDTNGDGLHTAADQLNPNGTPTPVDVYLITNQNRNGTPAVCNADAAVPLTINSYLFDLLAVNGKAVYSNFVNQQAGFTIGFQEANPDSERYKNGFGGSTYIAAGKYKLASLTIKGVSGSPSIQIVDKLTGIPDITGFGSECIGHDLDNTYKLTGPGGGTDWTDVDGLAAAPGGNTPPTLTVAADTTAATGALFAITAVATDPDASDILTITQSNTTPFLTTFTAVPKVSPAVAVLSGTPAGTGVFDINWSVTDGVNTAVTAHTLLTVVTGGGNQCPVLFPIGNKTVTQLSLLTFTATAADPDAGQTLTFSLDAGAPSGAAIDASTGVFTWTPTAAQGPGVFPITVRVTDNGTPEPCSDFEAIDVTVNAVAVNQCPVLAPIGNKTVTQLSLLTFTATVTDPDPGQTLTFSLNAGAPTGAAIDASTGVFTWTPTAAQGPGVFPITVLVTDNGTPEPCFDLEAIDVTVNAAGGGNQCPALDPIGDKTITQLSLLTFTATATDPDAGQTLTFSLDAGAPAGATINATTGVFTWTPTSEQFAGAYYAAVRVTDNGTPDPCSDFEVIQIVVYQGFNHCPVLDPIGDKTVTQLSLLTFTATATDVDPGEQLIFSLGAGAPSGATITQGSEDVSPATAVFAWTPTAAQGPGVFPITVRVFDNFTPACGDSETINVTVNAAGGGNQCPTLTSIGNKTVDELTLLTFTATATDPDVGQTLTFSLDAGAPSGAAINSSTGVFTWTPTEAQGPGVYSITVRVTDNGTPEPCSDFETIQVTVNEVGGGGGNFTAAAFFIGGNTTTRLWAGKPVTCVQIEPTNGSFQNTDVDLSSIVMLYNGNQISAASATLSRDTNGNGVKEITACFSKQSLRNLFAGLPVGENFVDVTIQGNLTLGGTFTATATHRVLSNGDIVGREHGHGDENGNKNGIGNGQDNGADNGNGKGDTGPTKKFFADASPNPMNPETVLSFRTSREGAVRVAVFDLSGRLVSRIYEGALPAGMNFVRWDGSAANGNRVSSGVYFLKVQSVDGSAVVRVTVLK